MYEFKSRVRYSEVGEDKKLTLNSIINYFQDCSTFQSEELGVGLACLEERKHAWILSSWQIVIARYPELTEEITVGTWPYEFGIFSGTRNFIMKDAAGKPLAYANSLWIYLNMETGRPDRVPEDILAKYHLEEKYPMNYASRKVPMPIEAEPGEAFPVKKHHLDTNHHVNNGQYIAMAKDFLPDGIVICEMRTEYKKSALLGDMIYPWIQKTEEGCVVALCDEQKKPYAVVELKTKETDI